MQRYRERDLVYRSQTLTENISNSVKLTWKCAAGATGVERLVWLFLLCLTGNFQSFVIITRIFQPRGSSTEVNFSTDLGPPWAWTHESQIPVERDEEGKGSREVRGVKNSMEGCSNGCEAQNTTFHGCKYITFILAVWPSCWLHISHCYLTTHMRFQIMFSPYFSVGTCWNYSGRVSFYKSLHIYIFSLHCLDFWKVTSSDTPVQYMVYMWVRNGGRTFQLEDIKLPRCWCVDWSDCTVGGEDTGVIQPQREQAKSAGWLPWPSINSSWAIWRVAAKDASCRDTGRGVCVWQQWHWQKTRQTDKIATPFVREFSHSLWRD